MGTNYYLRQPRCCRSTETQILKWIDKLINETPSDRTFIVPVGFTQQVHAVLDDLVVMHRRDILGSSPALKVQLMAIFDGINEQRYLTEPCTCCSLSERKMLQIGKSSSGWCFSLRVYPNASYIDKSIWGVESINTLNDWLPLFERFEIVDEYDRVVKDTELISIIRDRKRPADMHPIAEIDAWNMGGSGVDQKSGLVRHIVDDVHKHNAHCIGHGSGPWDYCVGEFS